ncbi:MAG: heat-inducible transcription repressor HrcA [Acidobacteriaceae bacterium]|nr:heat-inducible transcription repressor HrcA [Acidobacteriaceae bacterium]MBV9036053.1 heat-inducible transcription repressor HrcA [Acidobacteriaceae bacterium]MBV9226236.1 heat-inducible transcription repressor HrcA [Acidobacteriaceae bacterium]MBV9675236.1 heat-inducible transcription repressor HrcA [Acidobacteriaceae bacterium]MBV9938255.1 heat-inducible transcription repressor HrcA [Acidobacteriaceae bacterium]
MNHLGTLTPRHFQVLHALVQNYIETGEPVASRAIAHKYPMSAASIRNMMADLLDEGYLSQPHTSAGRVPTERAYQSYVKTLLDNRIIKAELDRLQAEIRREGTVEGRIERSSKLLTEITRNFGIAAAIPTENQILDQVELLALPDCRVLMVVVTRDRMVRNKVITIDDPIAQDELNSIRNYINYNFSGWVLPSIHRELKRRLELESATYDAILRRVSLFHAKGLLDLGLAPEVHFDGAVNLIGLDLHLTRERMRELFRALEEKKRVLQLLERFLEQREGELSVQVGLSDVHPSMGELSLIGVRLGMPNGLDAHVAVLGPMRMNYSRALSAVLHVGQAFKTAT